jgi:hypothetical protein
MLLKNFLPKPLQEDNKGENKMCKEKYLQSVVISQNCIPAGVVRINGLSVLSTERFSSN